MKNIKIQVWTDLYYAKFIGIWRPEEEPGYTPPVNDPRPEQERNIPTLLVVNTMYRGRNELVDGVPVAPSQHPMPPEFLQQQVRQMAYCFAHSYCLFTPPSLAAAETFMAKMRVGFELSKELKVVVDDGDFITLRDFKTMLMGYSDSQLDSIKVRTTKENAIDAFTNGLKDYIHPLTPTTGYFTVTNLSNIYRVEDTELFSGLISMEDTKDGYPPGTLDMPMTQKLLNETQQNTAGIRAEAALLRKPVSPP